MSKTVGTGQITITDLTDGELVLDLNSNLANTQNLNTSSILTPDWSKTNLIITPHLFFNNEELPLNTQNLSIIFTKRKLNSEIEDIDNINEIFNASTKTLTVKKNMLLDSKIITYFCKATYTVNNKTFSSSGLMTFNLVKDGTNGESGYSIVMSNENHTFIGDTNHALEDSTTTEINVYKGTELQKIKITKINNVTVSSTQRTNTGITGLDYQLSTINEATNPTITFYTNTKMTTSSGKITIEIQVGQIKLTKNFSFSIAFKGQNGEEAAQVKITSKAQIFQSSDNGLTFLPEEIVLTPVFTNSTFGAWFYSLDDSGWGQITATSPSAGNDRFYIDTDTHNLIIPSKATNFNSTNAIAFQCTTTQGVYDLITISQIYDSRNLSIGGINLLKFTAYESLEGVSIRGDYAKISIDEDNIYNNNNSLKIVTTAGAVYANKDLYQSCWGEQTENENLTLSFYVKGTQSNGWVYYEGGSTTNNNRDINTFQITSNWTKVKISLGKVTNGGAAGGTRIVLGFANAGTFYVNSMKLEEGTIDTAWSAAPQDLTSDLDIFKQDLQNQIDGKIETYDQVEDPSLQWQESDYSKHTGDLWYSQSDKITYRWDGTNWVSNDGLAESAENIAKQKAKIFTAQPVPPYSIGDMWIDPGFNVYYCTNSKTEGMAFNINDWGFAATGDSTYDIRDNLLEIRTNPLEDWSSVTDPNISFISEKISSVITSTNMIYRANVNSFQIQVTNGYTTTSETMLGFRYYLKDLEYDPQNPEEIDVTLSFYIYNGSASSAQIYVTLPSLFSRNPFQIETIPSGLAMGWTRYIAHIKLPTSTRLETKIRWDTGVSSFIYVNFNRPGRYFITMPKLEKGTTDTPWISNITNDMLNYNTELTIDSKKVQVSFNNISQNIQLTELTSKDGSSQLASFVIKDDDIVLLSLNTEGFTINDEEGSPLISLDVNGLTLNPDETLGLNKITLTREGLKSYSSDNTLDIEFNGKGMSIYKEGYLLGNVMGSVQEGSTDYGIRMGLSYDDSNINREYIGFTAQDSPDDAYHYKLWYTRGRNENTRVFSDVSVEHSGSSVLFCMANGFKANGGLDWNGDRLYFQNTGTYMNWHNVFQVGPRRDPNFFDFYNINSINNGFNFCYGTGSPNSSTAYAKFGYDATNKYPYIDLLPTWLTIGATNINIQTGNAITCRRELNMQGNNITNSVIKGNFKLDSSTYNNGSYSGSDFIYTNKNAASGNRIRYMYLDPATKALVVITQDGVSHFFGV